MPKRATHPSLDVIGKPDTLAQRAYKAIRQGIREGTLSQGTRYSEAELAATMEISRTPVREALIELSREGLVEILPQRGFRLRSLTLAEQEEVFDLRLLLESYSIERLAKVATADDVAQLRELLRRQRELLDEPSEFLVVDEQFHLLMPYLVGLERTHKVLATLRGAMWLIANVALSLRDRASYIVEEHTAVVDAIEAHDVEAALSAIRAHLSKTADAFELGGGSD
jgi:DNA-binding GntR family transcriptional regulator